MSCQNDEARSALLAPEPELISKLQELFRIGAANPISLRALWPVERKRNAHNLTFSADAFPDPLSRWRAAFDAALRLNKEGYNLYTLLNPIRPDFSGKAVSDNDIVSRRLLLLDFDRAAMSKQPATDAEVEDAMTTADRVEEWMTGLGVSTAARVMSGNGAHLYFNLDDLPNDTCSRDGCRTFLRALAVQFDSATIKVDTAVFNASRVTKLPGTIARKGLELADRPYRRASFK